MPVFILMYAVKATGTLRVSKAGELEGLDLEIDRAIAFGAAESELRAIDVSFVARLRFQSRLRARDSGLQSRIARRGKARRNPGLFFVQEAIGPG